MTPKQRAIEDMILIGRRMSNLCYGLCQDEKRVPSPCDRQTMTELYGQWDSCVHVYRKLTQKAQARPLEPRSEK
jgi:hypothetical protein